MTLQRKDELEYSGADRKLAEMSAYPERFEKPGVSVTAAELQRFKEQQIKANGGTSSHE